MLALLASPALAQPTNFDINGAANSLLRLIRPSISGGYVAGQLAMKELNTAEAARFFGGAVRADWDNPILLERAFVAYAADGQISESANTAQQFLQFVPNSELAGLIIGTEALRERRYGTVERALGDLGEDTFTGITAGLLRAWAMVGDGRADEADALMARLGNSGLEDFLVYHRALMAQVAGNTELALELAEDAFDADPATFRTAETYARLLANGGDTEAALDVLDQHQGGNGFAHPVIRELRETLEAGRRPALFPATVQGGAAEMFHGIGVVLSREGGADLALVFLRLAMYLDPAGDVIPMSVGELLDVAGQHDAASAIYDAIPPESPMKPTAVVRIAQNLDADGDRDEAIRRLRNIVAINPDDLQAVSALGDILSSGEDWMEAAEAYSGALEINGDENLTAARLRFVRGIAYERGGEWELAEADFLRSLELDPEQPSVLNYLGYSWIDRDMHLDRALGMIEEAVAARPDDAYIIDSLGWAFYKLGRLEEAVATLEQAVSILPNDPEINDHLGDAYWQVGRKREARFQWTIAQSVDAVGTVAARTAPKLAEGLAPEIQTQ
jgi:tetratricopeptide (TPR) repeat protein